MTFKNNGPGGCCCDNGGDCCSRWPDTINAATQLMTTEDPFGLGGTWQSTKIYQFTVSKVSDYIREGEQAVTGAPGLKVRTHCQPFTDGSWLVEMFRLDTGAGYGQFQYGPREYLNRLHLSGCNPFGFTLGYTNWSLRVPLILNSGDINDKPTAHPESPPCTPQGYSYVHECEFGANITFFTAADKRTVTALATESSATTGPHVFMYFAQGVWTSAGDTGNLFSDFVPPVPDAADYTEKSARLALLWDRIGGSYSASMFQQSRKPGGNWWTWYLAAGLNSPGGSSGSPGCSGRVMVPLYRRVQGGSETQIGSFQIEHSPFSL